MPGVYALGDYDLAGFIVGLVEPGASRGRRFRAGDVLVGLPSSGLHTNGYSLVRKVFEDVPLTTCSASSAGRWRGAAGAAPLLPRRAAAASAGRRAAHITGGGILGNLPRCLPEGLGARLDRGGVEACRRSSS